MNKLASIFYLQSMGLPTVDPQIVRVYSEDKIRKFVGSFYDSETGWVLRCGELPDKKAKIEKMLPWDIANDKEELVKKILELQEDIGDEYFVFCHRVMDMVRGGTMLIEGNRVVIEAAEGNPRELSAMFRGYRSPEQLFIFNPGMMSFSDSGKEVLSTQDLSDARKIERKFNWSDIGAVVNSVTVEFSRLTNERLYVHDFRVIS